MSSVISHRGPDDDGIWFDSGKEIGLAHRRLSIIDLSAMGHQPMWDVSERVAITFNGEIYNYRELRNDLIRNGYYFKSQSDTEVLLNLYLQYDTEMFSHINGMFAFSIWDSRKNLMLLARDALGVKPLYYAETSDGFLFASEMKAILECKSIERDYDFKAISYYLAYLWAPAPHTMLKFVKKLEPGSAIIVKNGKIEKLWSFYKLPYDQAIVNLGEQESIEKLLFKLKCAVNRQMVADVEVGAFLSGGLDSSAIVTFANEFSHNHRMKCFTIDTSSQKFADEGFDDDLPYARRVAEKLDLELHTITVNPEKMDWLEKMIYHLDEPQADPAAINVFFIGELARQHGIKVLMSGLGGDDVFSGYRKHMALNWERLWSWLPLPVRSLQRKCCNRVSDFSPVGRRIRKMFQYADIEKDQRLISYYYWTTPELIEKLFSEDVGKEISPLRIESPLMESLSMLDKGVPDLNKMLYLDGRHFLGDHNLNYTDKMSMASGVEVRVPFLDTDLISFAAKLPVSLKLKGFQSKWILKKSMEKYLPRDVIYRRKTGFGLPIRRWMRTGMGKYVDEILSESALKKRGLFSPSEVRRLIQSNWVGESDRTYTIFSLMCIELWCRIFIDRKMC